MLDGRNAVLLRGISPDSRILELGPSMSPVAPRSAGWDVTVVDHATQDELVEKYRHDVHVDVTRIEKVDYVWSGGPLHQVVPEALHGTFDVIIASHVIEHIPDPIGFLDSAAKLINPVHGTLALAVPDKRWCFDCLKQVSTTGQMLEAHRLRAQRHSAATRFDASAYVAFDGTRSSWGREPLPSMYLPDTLEHAFAEFQAWSDNPDAPYVDCHAWHFTPASFELILLELAACGLCDWHIAWLSPQPAVEFLTQLRPRPALFGSAKERDLKRLALLKQILLDLREQIDCMFEPVSPARGFDAEARDQLRQVAANVAAVREQTRDELHQIAETATMVRTALRPARALWHSALPLRRAVARLRGRVR